MRRWAVGLMVGTWGALCAGFVPAQGQPSQPPVAAETRAPDAAAAVPWTTRYAPPSDQVKELQQIVSWNFQEQSLEEVAKAIGEKTGLTVVIAPAVAASGLAPEESVGGGFFFSGGTGKPRDPNQPLKETVTSRVDEVPLWSALCALVTDAHYGEDIAWEYRDGVITLSVAWASEEHRRPRHYDLAPLVDRKVDLTRLKRILERSIVGPWDFEEPGTSNSSVIGRTLVVNASQRTQRELESLLAGLLQPEASEVILNEPPQNERIRAALARPFTANFRGATLQEVAAEIERQMSIPVSVHRDCEPVHASAPPLRVTLQLREKPLSRFLELMREVSPGDHEEIGAFPDSGRLLFKRDTFQFTALEPRLYDLRDFERAGQTEALVESMQLLVYGPWDVDEPGTGTLAMLSSDQLLVRQSHATHGRVAEFLRSQRAVLSRNPTTRRRIETRAYFVKASDAEALRGLIVGTVAPGTWGPGGPGTLRGFPIPRDKFHPYFGESLFGLGCCSKDPYVPPPREPEPTPAKPVEELIPKAFKNTTADHYGHEENALRARAALLGAETLPHAVLVVRHEYDVHRQIDMRITQFFVDRPYEICLGLASQYSYLMDDVELPPAEPRPQ